jgi:hypothetical protein
MAFKKGNTYGLRASKAYKIAVKHSLNTYRRMLSGSKLDGRTALYRVLREKEQELITALGGDPSPQEKLIIADTVKTLLFIGTVDEYLMSLDGGIIRAGKMVPVVESRTSLASHLRRNLEALGLQRRVRTQSLQDILAANDHEDTPASTNGDQSTVHDGNGKKEG